MTEAVEKKEEEKPVEDVKVEVVDDAPPEDKTPKKPVKANGEDEDEELLTYSESVQKRINKIKREAHEHRRAKEAAERERAEAVQFAQRLFEENKQLQNRGHVDRGAMIANAEARITSQLSAAKQVLRDAFAASDADKIAEANEAIAKLTIENENVRRIKNAFAAQQEARQQRPVTPLQDSNSGVQHTPTAPAQQRPEPKALEWASNNTWFGRDPVMTGFAYGLHQKLVSDGVDPRSDDYYETISKAVRTKFPEEFAEDANAATDDSGEQTPPPRTVKTVSRPSTVVAPASRSTGGAKNVVLTASEAALARRLGLTNEQYAREKLRLTQGA